jgi:hypothetical protein
MCCVVPVTHLINLKLINQSPGRFRPGLFHWLATVNFWHKWHIVLRQKFPMARRSFAGVSKNALFSKVWRSPPVGISQAKLKVLENSFNQSTTKMENYETDTI